MNDVPAGGRQPRPAAKAGRTPQPTGLHQRRADRRARLRPASTASSGTAPASAVPTEQARRTGPRRPAGHRRSGRRPPVRIASPAPRRRDRVEARPGRFAGLRPPPDDRRLRGRRLRLRPRLHRSRARAAAEGVVREVVPHRDARHGEHPGHRRCAAGGQPFRHRRGRCADDGGRPARAPPAASARCGCWAPIWSSRPRSWVRSAARPATPWPAIPDAERLLASGQLVAVFPEGFKGVGKPYSQRYKLQRFGRGGIRHRRACGPACRSSRSRSSAPRRSTR